MKKNKKNFIESFDDLNFDGDNMSLEGLIDEIDFKNEREDEMIFSTNGFYYLEDLSNEKKENKTFFEIYFIDRKNKIQSYESLSSMELLKRGVSPELFSLLLSGRVILLPLEETETEDGKEKEFDKILIKKKKPLKI